LRTKEVKLVGIQDGVVAWWVVPQACLAAHQSIEVYMVWEKIGMQPNNETSHDELKTLRFHSNSLKEIRFHTKLSREVFGCFLFLNT
jgi:hypothetical protein